MVVNISTNNHLSSQIIQHKKNMTYMVLKIQVLDWDRHKNVVGLNQLMGSLIPPTPHFWQLDLQRKYRHKEKINNLHRYLLTSTWTVQYSRVNEFLYM